MRKRIIAGNWKMNKTPKQAIELVNLIKDGANSNDVDVVFCVPYVNLATVINELKGTNICVGAQNMHFEESGAFTGEISASMLKEMGVKYVVLGHSERRAYFGETDETVNLKTKVALQNGLTPIVCIGEVLPEREDGIAEEVVKIQVKKALKGISSEDAKNIVLAYEPVWAIGTGKTATSEQAQEICKVVRDTVKELYGESVSEVVRVQYGGSMNASNAKELLSMKDIDGGLIGGASLKAEFNDIVNA